MSCKNLNHLISIKLCPQHTKESEFPLLACRALCRQALRHTIGDKKLLGEKLSHSEINQNAEKDQLGGRRSRSEFHQQIKSKLPAYPRLQTRAFGFNETFDMGEPGGSGLVLVLTWNFYFHPNEKHWQNKEHEKLDMKRNSLCKEKSLVTTSRPKEREN